MPKQGDGSTKPPGEDGDGPPLRELRLALVCYGGVSLAIYMHGVTKEIHKLVRASEGRLLSPETNPFKADETEHVYWEALRQQEEEDPHGVRTRVVVDIISGTSAGGINGVFLAKALAHNNSLSALRNLWMEKGDINKLVIPHGVPTMALKVAAWLGGKIFPGNRGKPLLDGNFMLKALHEALSGMSETTDDIGKFHRDTLMPEDTLTGGPAGPDLFVTTTDFRGYLRDALAYSPSDLSDEWHRVVFHFTRGGDRDRYRADHDAALAFSARATSSFPGAFPPVGIRDSRDILPNWPEAFIDDFFRIYQLSHKNPLESWFVDGGVLDNFPFDNAIAAIFEKPAETQVVRRLVYIEPDPRVIHGVPAEERASSQPGFVRTAWGGLSTIPRGQPIIVSLLEAQKFNDRVQMVRTMVDGAYEHVKEIVESPPPSGKSLNEQVHDSLQGTSGAFEAYERLKVVAVVAALAGTISDVCDFPIDSSHRWFVQDVMRRWSESPGGVADFTAARDADARIEFLRTFDLGYTVRRVKFVIRRLSEWYSPRAGERPPSRGQLDGAKRALYKQLEALEKPRSALISGSGAAAAPRDSIREIFKQEDIWAVLRDGPAAAGDFLQARRVEIDKLRADVGTFLDTQLGDFGDRLRDALDKATEGWSKEAKEEILVRFVGFPAWDSLIYPIMRNANVGELNPVKVVRLSPNDTEILEPRGEGASKEKLLGVKRAHFGAFFQLSDRQNDYLWGRLDGAERVLWLLRDARGDGPAVAPDRARVLEAFRAVIKEESGPGGLDQGLLAKMTAKVDEVAP